MRSKIGAGIVAGLIGGVVFGMGMQMMSAPTPAGPMSMIDMVGKIIGQPNPVGGWLYHLFNSAVIGAIFGAVFSNRVASWRAGLGWGIIYGMIWWVLGGLILMPLLLSTPAFAPLVMPGMQPVAWGSLMGHAMYGIITGLVFRWLYKPTPRTIPSEQRERVASR